MITETLPPVVEHEAAPGLIRVLVADDHPVVREGIAATLAGWDGVEPVGEAASAEECIELIDATRPGVVVTDVRLPGMDGIEACRLIRECHPSVAVIVLTMFANESVLARAFAAGAAGLVVKDSRLESLRTALEVVASGRSFVDPQVAGMLVSLASQGARASGPYGLTVQEMRVIEELPRGLSNREIAWVLGVSVDTVKTHLRHAFAKLGANDRSHAVALAVRDGLA